MSHNKKSRAVIMYSAVLLGGILVGAIYLGAVSFDNMIPYREVSLEQKAYNLDDIANYKTPYLGDNSKVSAIVGQLPEPDHYFKQRYISMVTDGTNKLNVFYEANVGATHSNEWPVANPENPTYSNMQKNALVLFCMIDNLNEVTFAFRDSPSDGKLDSTKYTTAFNFSRASVQERFGNLSIIGGNLEKLQDALIGENI